MKTKTLKRSDWKALHSYLCESNHPFDLIIQVALETGARVSEVVGVKRSDLSDGAISLTASKGSRNRTIKVSQNLVEKILATQPTAKDLFSVRSTAVSTCSRRRILDRRLRWLCQRVGIRECGMHTLRHTICSEIYRETKDLYAVRDFIGHRALSSTLRYMHLNNKEEAETVVLGLLA